MSGSHSRNKGARFERDTVHWIESLGFSARRLGPVQADGKGGPDVEAGRKEHGLIGWGPTFWIECKAHKRVNWRRALEQTQGYAQPDHVIQFVRAKDDRCEPVIVMTQENFERLIG